LAPEPPITSSTSRSGAPSPLTSLIFSRHGKLPIRIVEATNVLGVVWR